MSCRCSFGIVDIHADQNVSNRRDHRERRVLLAMKLRLITSRHGFANLHPLLFRAAWQLLYVISLRTLRALRLGSQANPM